MDFFSKLAEKRIREAQETGVFDNLEGAAESNLRRRSQLKREINEKSVYLNILIERRLQRRKSSI